MKKSSVPSAILMILREIGQITAQAFFNPRYAKKYGYSHLYPHLYKSHSTRYVAFSRLKKRGLIAKNGDIYYLTSKGEKEAFFVLLKSCGVNNSLKNTARDKPQKWDGKWRIIFFDVPEKKRRYRDKLRAMIRAIGFKEFQKSIWIYPYKVPEFLKEILFEENIKHYTRLITTDNIEYDKDLRKMFRV